MLTEREARDFARDWLQAWNFRDLDAILPHYAAEVVLEAWEPAFEIRHRRLVSSPELRAYLTAESGHLPVTIYQYALAEAGIT